MFLQVEEGECFFTIAGSNVTRCVDVALVYIKNSNNKVCDFAEKPIEITTSNRPTEVAFFA